MSDKEEVAEEKKAPWVAKRLLALADGYSQITKIRKKLRDEVNTKEGQFFRFLGFDNAPHFLLTYWLN